MCLTDQDGLKGCAAGGGVLEALGPRCVNHLYAAVGGGLLALGPQGVPHLWKAGAAKASRTTREARGGTTRLELA